MTNFRATDLDFAIFHFNISFFAQPKIRKPLIFGAKIHIFPQKTNVKPENLTISHKFSQKS